MPGGRHTQRQADVRPTNEPQPIAQFPVVAGEHSTVKEGLATLLYGGEGTCEVVVGNATVVGILDGEVAVVKAVRLQACSVERVFTPALTIYGTSRYDSLALEHFGSLESVPRTLCELERLGEQQMVAWRLRDIRQ